MCNLFLYVLDQGVSKVGEIFWRTFGFLLVVDQLSCTNLSFLNNGLGDRHGHRYKEDNGAKNPGYAISIIVSLLNYFDLSYS